MAYGFNDDKSKYEIVDMRDQLVPYSDYVSDSKIFARRYGNVVCISGRLICSQDLNYYQSVEFAVPSDYLPNADSEFEKSANTYLMSRILLAVVNRISGKLRLTLINLETLTQDAFKASNEYSFTLTYVI